MKVISINRAPVSAKGEPIGWRDIVDAREWQRYRLARYRSNLAEAALLREFRRKMNVSQIAVCKRINVSQGSVSRWESGQSRFPEYRVAQFRRAVVALAKKVK